MKKKLVRLTENDLHKIVENSVKRILKEDNIGADNSTMDLFQEIKDAGYEDEVISRLISYVGDRTFKNILDEIYELYFNTDEDETFDMPNHFDEQGYYDDND